MVTTKPLSEYTAKQLEKALAKAQRQYARFGSVATIKRLDAVQAEIAQRVSA